MQYIKFAFQNLKLIYNSRKTDKAKNFIIGRSILRFEDWTLSRISIFARITVEPSTSHTLFCLKKMWLFWYIKDFRQGSVFPCSHQFFLSKFCKLWKQFLYQKNSNTRIDINDAKSFKYPNSHAYPNSHTFFGVTKKWLFGGYTVFRSNQL